DGGSDVAQARAERVDVGPHVGANRRASGQEHGLRAVNDLELLVREGPPAVEVHEFPVGPVALEQLDGALPNQEVAGIVLRARQKDVVAAHATSSQVNTWSSARSRAATRPMTASISAGLMPWPGRFHVRCSLPITVPAGMGTAVTRLRLAWLRLTVSCPRTPRSNLPTSVTALSRRATSRARSSLSSAW